MMDEPIMADSGARPPDCGHATLGQRVHRELQARILNGHLLPGTKLTLRSLAESLDTSIQPVREAVGRLAADRAVEVTPNRSILIPQRTKADLDDLYAMRVMIEGEAAARFATQAASADLEILRLITEDLRASYGRGVVPTVTHMQRFGLLIARLARSETMEGTIFSLRLQTGPHLAEALSRPEPFDPGFIQFTVHINEQIILAFQDRDASRARDLRRSDIATLQRVLYARLGLPTARG